MQQSLGKAIRREASVCSESTGNRETHFYSASEATDDIVAAGKEAAGGAGSSLFGVPRSIAGAEARIRPSAIRSWRVGLNDLGYSP